MKDRWSQLSMSEKSDLMSLYIRNGISSLEEIKKHYNSFADGGQMNINGPDEPNFVGGATALKKDYNYELEHLADKYAITAKGPWHDYGINNPSSSQKSHWNELTRMYNRVAQRPNYEYLNPINIAEYAPVIGDAIDAGRSVYDLQQGNTGVGLAGLGLLALPNFIEEPLKLGTKVLRLPVQVVKNIKANRNINSQNEVLETVWNNLLERESRDTGVYRHSRAERELKNSNSNMFHALSNEIHYPQVNQSANIIRYMYNGTMPKTLKEVTKGFKEGVHNLFKTDAYNLDDVIYINPINWATGPTDFRGLLGHEAQHSVQRTLPQSYRLSMDNPNSEYFTNNTENRYTRDLLKPFERKSNEWKGSPEELDSEIIRWKLINDIKLNKDFSTFDPEIKQSFINKTAKRFALENWEAENILNGLSRNQYFNYGGKLT